MIKGQEANHFLYFFLSVSFSRTDSNMPIQSCEAFMRLAVEPMQRLFVDLQVGHLLRDDKQNVRQSDEPVSISAHSVMR